MNEELKTLTDKFLAEHGALTKPEDEKINANVLLASPTHDGDLKFGTVISLVNQTRIDSETKNYESEDFYFCTEVRKHGFEVWALASERTSHFGTYNFSLNMQAIASLGAAQSAGG